jgi:membrane-associated phospholipid phosphatase
MSSERDAAVVLGSWLGGRAAEGFAISLLLLVAGVIAAWWSLRRWGVHRETSRLPPVAFSLLWLVAGFGLLVGAGAIFAELADGLDGDESMGHFDDAFSAAIQRGTPSSVLHAFAAITRLGDAATLSVIGLLVFFALLRRQGFRLALVWGAAVGGNALLNVSLKLVFARARPVHDGGLVLADGFSFPSGHASGSVVTYGMLAYLALRLLPGRWHLPALLLAALAAFSIGSSRVFLRVHYPSDVLAGFASGSAWLAMCILGIELARRFRTARA